MAEDSLHIVLFPWLAFGHMIPYLHLSKILASLGHRISFLSTPRNLHRLPKLPSSLSSLIRFVPLPLPHSSHSTIADAESTTDLPRPIADFLFDAFDELRQPVADFLRDLSPKPDWIVHDFAPFWLPAIGEELGVPCAVFNTFPSFFAAFFGFIILKNEFSPSSFPLPLRIRSFEIKQVMENEHPDVPKVKVQDRWKTVYGRCKFVAIRGCDEFDGEWLRILKESFEIPFVPVGLLTPERPEFIAGKMFDFLSKRTSGSVVYVSLGSEVALSVELYHELALALELSTFTFVWALRRPPGMAETVDLLPDGFIDRTAGRGIVAMDWAPQVGILGHEAVGAFLTHCGWSSLVEGLAFGRPLVMLPMIFDQGINSQVMAEKKVGVEIERNEEDGSFTKDAVMKALRLVLVEEEGEEVRENARKMKDICGNLELQEMYVDKFVQYLRDHKQA
ncbi:putative UDP-rhamnose:rhamnosyltransferase 1 [Typha angustifolia]|uniref:putative UDP-rhamnose:rhamnosyltransferase 1 n=1 Tax=Typha angustifolia TaxID=59011 RepID=UPI003C2DDA59